MGNPSAGTAKALFRPPFLIACIVLGFAGFVVSGAIQAESGRAKESLPLKASLGKLDKEGFGPYRFVTRNTLSSAMVESLGTDEYIDWQFEDTSIANPQSPLRFARLFVTYYTGGRDLVPHTPDQCYVGGGYQPIQAENLEVAIPSLGQSVPVRVITFQKSAIYARETPTVVYTFHCNGEFTCTRDGVRINVNSSDRHAYFSKIEVVFGSGQSRPTRPSREESVEGAAKLLNYALPMLIKDHLPDWEAVKLAEEKAKASKASI
jgi:hypothetical protein